MFLQFSSLKAKVATNRPSTIQKTINFVCLGLANALSETNHNLHTFEFMLGQYRQMAKISPFLVKASEEAVAGVNIMSKSESNLSTSKTNDDVIEQLKVLSEAISQMKTSSEEVTAISTEEFLDSKQHVSRK